MNNCPECRPSTLTIHGEKTLRKKIELLTAVKDAAAMIPKIESLRKAGHTFPMLEASLAAVDKD